MECVQILIKKLYVLVACPLRTEDGLCKLEDLQTQDAVDPEKVLPMNNLLLIFGIAEHFLLQWSKSNRHAKLMWCIKLRYLNKKNVNIQNANFTSSLKNGCKPQHQWLVVITIEEFHVQALFVINNYSVTLLNVICNHYVILFVIVCWRLVQCSAIDSLRRISDVRQSPCRQDWRWQL